MRKSLLTRATHKWLPILLIFCCQPIVGQELATHPTSNNELALSSAWSAAAEKYQVDQLDLYALAFQESRRRRPDGMMRPWPWTLNSPRTGALYFQSYEEALQTLTSLLEAGETNVDVGLMGINWYWNGRRAADAKSLLQPSQNIAIAAQILRERLNESGGDRRLAIARYHSSRLERGIPYAASVLAIADHLRSVADFHLALAD